MKQNGSPQYTEPEDMGRELGMQSRLQPEMFLNPGDNFSEMLMRNRLDQDASLLVLMAMNECMEIGDEPGLWLLQQVFTMGAGASGKAWDAALASLTRAQAVTPPRKRGWGFKRKTPAEFEPKDLEG